jgi:hypothetical protein
MNLQEQIRKVLKEELHSTTYIIRRMRCFDEFINELENNGLEVMPPAIRNARLEWNSYQIILTALMRNYCGDSGYYDENLHQKIIDYYEDRLYKWFKKNIKG